MFNSIIFYLFIDYSTIYINVILKIPLGLIKLSRIAFPGIFVSVCFLIILLLAKQTMPTKKKLTKQGKYKNGSKANPTFYILRRTLLIISLGPLASKTKQPKGTGMAYSCVKSSNFFSVNSLEILDITKENFLR